MKLSELFYEVWMGILYMIVGAYLLIRHRTEADRTIKWASQASFFGGPPRQLGQFSTAVIRAGTILAGVAAFILGVVSVIGPSSCLAR